jgi:hypothetical protein
MTESAKKVRDIVATRPGITYRELCNAIGWQSVNMRRQARDGKFNYFSIKPRGEIVRYYLLPDRGVANMYAPQRADMELTL